MDAQMDNEQDLFISHASADKDAYIFPLADALTREGVTYWLDAIEIRWGDSIALGINDGLRASRFVLLCLSQHFLERPWPETEFSSALAIQNRTGTKRVLPLILNSKDSVLRQYPILSGVAYREYSEPHLLAKEVAQVVKLPNRPTGHLRVLIESVHTGQLCNLDVTPRVSVKWLSQKGQAGLGLSEEAQTGGFVPFRIRWVLVDTKAEDYWKCLPRSRKRQITAVVQSADGPVCSETDRARLDDIGVYDGVTFHMYAIEDEDYDPPDACW